MPFFLPACRQVSGFSKEGDHRFKGREKLKTTY